MAQQNSAVVFVHGLFSSPNAWACFDRLLAADEELQGVKLLFFGYKSKKYRWRPDRRIPDFNTLADHLKTFLEVVAEQYTDIVLVAHSQGGLIVQRYLARMLAARQGYRLSRIRRIVLFACPNSGAELFLLTRRRLLGRHPQEVELRPLNEIVAETHQIIINSIMRADRVAFDQCPIPIYAYAGEEDNVVRLISAKGAFDNTGVVPGDHGGVIRPDSSSHTSYVVLRYNLLGALRQLEAAADPRRSSRSGGLRGAWSHTHPQTAHNRCSLTWEATASRRAGIASRARLRSL